MRGYPSIKLRAGQRSTPVPPTPPVPVSIPAPIGGWNARDPLAAMGRADAVVMDNMYPQTGSVDLRPGRVTWATGADAAIKSLLPYNGPTSSKLFAATNAHFYDVTAQGAVGAAVTTCTNAKWDSANMTTSGGHFMMSVNGVDNAKLYDGTTWETVTGVSTHAITNIATTALIDVHIFKHRMWFVEKNTLNAWYLPTDSIAGAAVVFPLGPLFIRGGYLVCMETWTIDNGNGVDDLMVFVTSQGEIAVYQGTDPASASTWNLVGIFYAGAPVGNRCLRKFGGDLIYLSKLGGLYPLSKLLISSTIDRSKALSNKIDNAFVTAIRESFGTFGWDITIHPLYNAIMINVPVVEASISYQYIMNGTTQAWCRFTNWSADCFIQFGDDVYSAIGTKTYKNWIGTADDAVPISASCQTAYSSLGAPTQIELSRPMLLTSGNVTIQQAIDTDFNLFSTVPDQATFMFSSPQALWDSGTWDTSMWSSGALPSGQQWFTLPNNPGNFHSYRLQAVSSSGSVQWVSTDHVLARTSIL